MSLSLRGNLHIKTPSLKNTKANKEQSRKQKKKHKDRLQWDQRQGPLLLEYLSWSLVPESETRP